MATLATKMLFTQNSTPISSYNQDLLNLGPLMYKNTGANPSDKWVGPNPIAVARPVDNSTVPCMMPHVLSFSNDLQYVFLADAAAAAATRRVVLYTYSITNAVYNYIGYITLTYPATTNHTIRGFRVDRLRYMIGTVSVSDTAVTGTGTLWTTNGKISVGARIGFGSINPAEISTWYQISAIGSDTSITLGSGAGTISAGTPFIIEEYRVVTVTTNATAANGGLFVTKGLNPSIFIPSGTTISAATSTDSLRAVYWLPNASTVTNTGGAGCAIEDEEYTAGTVSSTGTTTITGSGTSWNSVAGRINAGSRIGFGSTNPLSITTWYTISAVNSTTQITLTSAPATIPAGTAYCIIDNSMRISYVLDTAGRVHKYNLRSSLGTITSGKASNYAGIQLLATGVQALTGTMQTTNNGRYAVLQSGPGANIPCLYFVTTTRIYRSVLTDITSGSTTWAFDAMVEVPAGGAATYPVTGAMSSVEVIDTLNKLVISTTPTVAVGKTYITGYKTDASQFDYNVFIDNHQQDQSTADSSAAIIPNQNGLTFTAWSESGVTHVIRHPAVGTAPTAINNQMYAVPIGADWDFAATTLSRIITPRIATPEANNLNTVSVLSAKFIGQSSLGIQPLPYRVYCRTSGITDNSGSWTLIDDLGNISGVSASTHVQFMFEFKTISQVVLPARIYGVHVSYDNISPLPNYRSDATRSNAASKLFAFRFVTAFGETVPDLRIRIYNDITGGLLVDDNTVTSTGTWSKSTDGDNWSTYNTNDKTNETTYIRYAPASMASGVIARAVITRM
jgi:hypothetical protein